MPNQQKKAKQEQEGSLSGNGSMAESSNTTAAFEVIVLVSNLHTSIEMFHKTLIHVSGLDFVSQTRGVEIRSASFDADLV
jgi:hypothetical protein